MLNPQRFTAEEVETARRIADAWCSLAATCVFGGLLVPLWGGVRRWSLAWSFILGFTGILTGYIIWHFVIPGSVEAFREGIVTHLHGRYRRQLGIPAALATSLLWPTIAYTLGAALTTLTKHLLKPRLS